MIKCFRQIRQNLLSEGRNGKYLKYTLGEIVLVVFGILIVLSINNRNEKLQLALEAYINDAPELLYSVTPVESYN